MNVLMNPKIIFIVFGVINILHGLGFLFGGGEVFTGSISTLNITEETNSVVSFVMEITAGFNFILGITLLFCRNLKFSEAKNVLIGLGIGIIVMVALAIKHHIDWGDAGPGIIGILIFVILAIWPLYAGIKGKNTESD